MCSFSSSSIRSIDQCAHARVGELIPHAAFLIFAQATDQSFANGFAQVRRARVAWASPPKPQRPAMRRSCRPMHAPISMAVSVSRRQLLELPLDAFARVVGEEVRANLLEIPRPLIVQRVVEQRVLIVQFEQQFEHVRRNAVGFGVDLGGQFANARFGLRQQVREQRTQMILVERRSARCRWFCRRSVRR